MELKKIIKDYGIKATGVVHVGAFAGEDYNTYKQAEVNNVIFIEPCKTAFANLANKFENNEDVLLFNCANGATDFAGNMYCERDTQGRANSLLKPNLHLTIFPDVQFNLTEQVRVKKLDNQPFKRGKYNFLVVDTNGYELEVLKGATATLETIESIYTTVYRDEVYAGSAKVEQIDEFLKDFKRVQTDWVSETTGFAMYLRKTNFSFGDEQVVETGFGSAPPAIDGDSKIIPTPEQLRPVSTRKMPEDNTPAFEEWYHKNLNPLDISQGERFYIPVYWSAYYLANRYDELAMSYLQSFIDSLDKEKKYYTITMYDDGILSDISKLDIKVFAASGDRIDYPLPLLCQPHKLKYIENKPRDVFATFSGANTHHVRNELFNRLKKIPNRYYITGATAKLDGFCMMLNRADFALAPRGYGKQSYRVAEALQYGSIPVYVSDEFVIPHNVPFNDYGVLIEHGEDIDEKLQSITPQEIADKKAKLKITYEKYFTFEGNKKIIDGIVVAEVTAKEGNVEISGLNIAMAVRNYNPHDTEIKDAEQPLDLTHGGLIPSTLPTGSDNALDITLYPKPNPAVVKANPLVPPVSNEPKQENQKKKK